MSLDRYRMERTVLFRVRGISKINSVESGTGTITLYIGDNEGEVSREIIELAEEVVEENSPIGTRVLVEPFKKTPNPEKGLYELPADIRKSHIISLTRSDIEILVKCCVSNVHLYFAIEKCRKMQSKMQKIATLLIPF